MAVAPKNAEQHKPESFDGCSVVARRVWLLTCWAMLVVVLTGCQSPNNNAPMYGQSTIAPPGTANTAMSNPGAFAMSAPPMPNTSMPNGWAPPPGNGGAPANNWNSPSIFGSSNPAPVNATSSWNPSQPPNPYGQSGSIFDQAPRTQQQGIFDSFASSSSSHPGSFNPNSMYRGYESPNSSFTSATPAHSANRAAPLESGSGSWWDRLTGTKSTVPAAGNPSWNQPAPMGAPYPAGTPNSVAWNDPRNPNYARPTIPNPNAVPNNGWNITSAPNSYAQNPLSSAPNYTNYGATAPSYPPNNVARTLPASTNPLRPTNTLPAGWNNGGGAAPATPSIPATGPIAVRNLEDLPPAR